MKELQKLSDAELTKHIEEQRELLRTYRFGTGGTNVAKIKDARRSIARALTLLTERDTATPSST